MQDKIVAAVCHGPAALTEAELNGKPLVQGKKVTQSNPELVLETHALDPSSCLAVQ